MFFTYLRRELRRRMRQVLAVPVLAAAGAVSAEEAEAPFAARRRPATRWPCTSSLR